MFGADKPAPYTNTDSRGSLPRRSIILRTYLGELRPFSGRAVQFICTKAVEGILLELESLFAKFDQPSQQFMKFASFWVSQRISYVYYYIKY